MTLAVALSGFNGTILFADSQETVGGYAKKEIAKVKIHGDSAGDPFIFAIANATDQGHYADALEAEITDALSNIKVFNNDDIRATLESTLTKFYSAHIWPSGKSTGIEYLLLVHPPTGEETSIFHIADTAVNSIFSHAKTIGIGSHLADYILKFATYRDGCDSLEKLIATAAYVAREVRGNVDGVGELHDILVFLPGGEGWDYVSRDDIAKIEANLKPMNEALVKTFCMATDYEPGDEDRSASEILCDITNAHSKWFREWETGRAVRQKKTAGLILRLNYGT